MVKYAIHWSYRFVRFSSILTSRKSLRELKDLWDFAVILRHNVSWNLMRGFFPIFLFATNSNPKMPFYNCSNMLIIQFLPVFVFPSYVFFCFFRFFMCYFSPWIFWLDSTRNICLRWCGSCITCRWLFLRRHLFGTSSKWMYIGNLEEYIYQWKSSWTYESFGSGAGRLGLIVMDFCVFFDWKYWGAGWFPVESNVWCIDLYYVYHKHQPNVGKYAIHGTGTYKVGPY